MTTKQKNPKGQTSELTLSSAIIERITSILKAKHMSQRDLSRKLGKTEAVISRWMTGAPNLTLRSICQISDALGEPIITVSDGKKPSSEPAGNPGYRTKSILIDSSTLKEMA